MSARGMSGKRGGLPRGETDAALPPWIRTRILADTSFEGVREYISASGLNSVCVEAACPNRCECWRNGHVTFLILGEMCTRNCLFCNVSGGIPGEPDREEPRKVARAVSRLGARYVVVTSVTRDDLEDKGAGQFIETASEIRKISPKTLVEFLIPDLGCSPDLIRKTASAGAVVTGHNIEMPRCLYGGVRPGTDYDASLRVLRVLDSVKRAGAGILAKSSMMIGLGESAADIEETLADLASAGVDILCIGQYLRPSASHWPVHRYYTPDEFDTLADKARGMGFRSVVSGPMVRSSYRAREAYEEARAV